MRNDLTKAKALTALGLLLTGLIVLGAVYFTGCTEQLQGDVYDNQQPIVYFVNIPPDRERFSRNPVVYWYGTDRDGLIDYYRYHIATVSMVGASTPGDYILTVHDSEWVYVDVEPASADPNTANILPLTADTTNPVRGFVSQWVFLQAFDTQGLGSEIAFRLFQRNDNPPVTQIFSIPAAALPFVNAEEAGGIVTGIRLRWDGLDVIDYPSDPPPFEYEWRLYGPYTQEDTTEIAANYIKEVFVTSDGFVYHIGETVERCDTLFTDTALDISCTTFVVEPGMPASALGQMDLIFDVEDTAFLASPLNNIVDSSFNGLDTWVLETSDTLYNVFTEIDVDTTVQLQFIFWIRCRDDAFVPDLAPAFVSFPVIDPRYERDIGVLDFMPATGADITNPNNSPDITSPPSGQSWTDVLNCDEDFHAVCFWWDLVERWNPNAVFDPDRDYAFAKKKFQLNIPLRFTLSHKVLILYNDEVQNAGMGVYMPGIAKAIDAGVNVWSIMRAPVYSGLALPPPSDLLPFGGIPFEYSLYFSVTKLVYSSWFCYAALAPTSCPTVRVEDFVGAYSLDPRWPDVNLVDSLVEQRYVWGFAGADYDPECPNCLPEVNWAEAGLGSEVMYLYKSIYGAGHPMGTTPQFDFVMEGTPVAHRFNPGLFRTAHFCFTPLAIEPGVFQVVFDTVMNFLYDPTISAAVSEQRYHDDAGMNLSVSGQRDRYWRRVDEAMREKGIDPNTPMDQYKYNLNEVGAQQ